jgi:tRNA (pseudouridine54-N1)-methyltransferase
MRTFVLYARGATSKFDADNLPAAGRMDLICRCVSSALYLSYSIREDMRMFVVMNGPPNPPVTICFDSKSSFYTDEKSISTLINKVLSSEIGEEWKRVESCKVARKSFQDVLKELEGNVYVLNEGGKEIGKIKDNPIFILGDNLGIPKNDEKFALRNGAKISLGKESYLASACISVLNWLCDRND